MSGGETLWAIPTIFQDIQFELPNPCKHCHPKPGNNARCHPCTIHAQKGLFQETYKTLLFTALTLLLSGHFVEAVVPLPPHRPTTTTLALVVKVLYGTGLLVLVLLSVLFVNALCKQTPGLPFEARQALSKAYLNTPAALQLRSKTRTMAEHLGQAIQFQTISYDATDVEHHTDHQEFLKLHAWFVKTYPLVHKHCTRHVVNDYSLVYEWTGEAGNQQQPYMVYGHMDVVPVLGQDWIQVDDPFSGEIKPDDTGKDHVWGRGAIDLKNICVGWMEAFEDLLESGFRPRRTVYLGMGHDEEIGGQEGAGAIARFMEQKLGPGKSLEFVWDEGLFVIDGVIKGHAAPVAMICTSEKGFVNVQLEVECPPQHSSFPPVLTSTNEGSPIDILSAACARLAKTPMKGHAEGPMRNMFEYLGPGFGWPLRLVMCNLWLLSSLVEKILSAKAKTASMVRTTTAMTIFNAGYKANVIPEKAKAVVNHRIHPKDTIASILQHDIKVINDPRVKVTVLTGMTREASPLSSHDTTTFQDLTTCCHEVYPDAVVAPSMFVAGSDSKHFIDLADNIYRFNPIFLRNEETKRFHGVDERIACENFRECVAFQREFIVKTDRRV